VTLATLRARLNMLAARVPTPPAPLPDLVIELVAWDDSAGRLAHTSTVTWDRCARTFREAPAPEANP